MDNSSVASLFSLPQKQYHSGYGANTASETHPSELTRLQETNEALSFDIKGVLDNKMRVESENFMLKKEIQRIRDQNHQLMSNKTQGGSQGNRGALTHEQDSVYHNESFQQHSLAPNSSFKLNLKRAVPNHQQPNDSAYDYTNKLLKIQLSDIKGIGGISRNESVIMGGKTNRRDISPPQYSTISDIISIKDGQQMTIRNPNKQTNLLPSLYGVDDFRGQIAQLNAQIQNEKRNNATLQDKLKDSEHKRHDSLRKNLELQKRILELEQELNKSKLKIKDIIIRKASFVLREQYIQMELDYNQALLQLKDLKEKEERFVQRVEHVKFTLKQQNDKYREVMDSERLSLMKHIDNYKLLVAEFKTENQDLKNLVVDLRKQVSVTSYQQEQKQVEAISDHVRELNMIVDQCKIKQIDTEALIQKLESKNGEIKVEVEVARRRAAAAENELLTLRKANYQHEMQNNELKLLLEEAQTRERETQKKCEQIQYEYHSLKFKGYGGSPIDHYAPPSNHHF